MDKPISYLQTDPPLGEYLAREKHLRKGEDEHEPLYRN